MPFGQIVVGPPGSGKTTYCNGILHYFELSGRKAAVINLDPANDRLPYQCLVNIDELVTLEAVQKELDLGPNGGLVYCMEYLAQNIDWLKKKLDPLTDDHYLIIDCPGQVELFNMHDSLLKIVTVMTDQWSIRLTAVHLVDSHLCSDPNKCVGLSLAAGCSCASTLAENLAIKRPEYLPTEAETTLLERRYLSAMLLSLSTMLHLALPHVNVLSKVDMIEAYGELDFNLDFYTDGGDVTRLADVINQNKRMAKYAKLTRGLCELVDDFGLVSFTTLNVQEEESMRRLVAIIDKSNGYVYAGIIKKARDGGQNVLPQLAASAPPEWDDERIGSVQEKYMRDRDDDVVAPAPD